MRLLYILLILTFSFPTLPDRLFAAALECVNTKFLFDIKPGANQPSDLAVAPDGDIYLVDGVNNRVIVVDGNGRWKFAFGSEGNGKGQFRFPLGIDISESGKVFIADSRNHRIQVFDLKGNFLYMFSVRREPGEVPPDPVDVAVSRLRDYLYISDNENHRIKVYRQNGVFEFEWGNFGEEFGEFRYPATLALNRTNEVFVVDVLNTRVQKFDPSGEFIAAIGSWGVLPGEFFRPKGVAVDGKNRVIVSDSYMGVLQVFTDLGQFIGVICKNGEKRVFRSPVGMVVDSAGRLLVVEMRGNKITVLKLLE